MSRLAEAPPSPSPRWAWFIDFDGTLVDIASKPGAIVVPSDLPGTLARIRATVDGALAIVTGRPAEQIHALLSPFRPSVAGLHGWESIDSDGTYHPPPPSLPEIAEMKRQFLAFARDHAGIMVEDKGIAVALHYREAPHLEGVVRAFVTRLFERPGNLTLIDGKMVFEVRPRGRDKGSAIRDMMSEPPFRGRIPAFAGDDATDEDAFAVVNALGGTTIQVGDRANTQARWRLPRPADFRAYLDRAAD